MDPELSARRRGLAFALLAFGAWGVIPIYWKAFVGIPAPEIIAHRLAWSLLVLLALVLWRRQVGECLGALRRPRVLAVLTLTTALLSLNWGVFVFAVNTGQIVESSLGYFINPLVSVALGCLVLRERLSRMQWVAVALAVAGVGLYGWHLWRVPWIALVLAASFGGYGLLRKMVPVGPVPGLLIETLLATPFALAYLGWLESRDAASFPGGPGLALLFASTGIITALPLIWFNAATKLLPLSTVGFLQYLAPTLQLLMGVAVYGERFTVREGTAFAFIWAAIALFLGASRRRSA